MVEHVARINLECFRMVYTVSESDNSTALPGMTKTLKGLKLSKDPERSSSLEHPQEKELKHEHPFFDHLTKNDLMSSQEDH